MTIVWHPSTARESIRRRLLSYSSRGSLMTHTDRSSSAASSKTHLSSLQRKHQDGTLLCFQVRSLARVVFVSAVFHNMRNWRATYKQYPLLYFPVKITEFVWKSSAFKNFFKPGSPVVGGANAQTANWLAGAHISSSLFWFQRISLSKCRRPD